MITITDPLQIFRVYVEKLQKAKHKLNRERPDETKKRNWKENMWLHRQTTVPNFNDADRKYTCSLQNSIQNRHTVV